MAAEESSIPPLPSEFSTIALDDAQSLDIQDSQTTNMAPISKLHPDVLWQIFLLNTNMDDGVLGKGPHSLAFVNTLHASQVCRDWRDLIVESPSLWARIIDLNVLWEVTDDWRKEVLRRTGDAALSIRGRMYHSNDFDERRGDSNSKLAIAFFFSLLNDEWERIRELDVVVYHPLFVNPSSWQALHRPAPSLEIFRLHLKCKAHSRIPPPSHIFADYAPSLREFKCPTVTIGINAPWLTHIRHLTLSFALSCPQILDILKMASSLETLILEKTMEIVDGTPPYPQHRQIHLPRIRKIRILYARESALHFLESIIPSLALSLALANLPTTELPVARSVISRFAQHYFDNPPENASISQLYLEFSRSSFRLSTHSLLKDTFSASSTLLIPKLRDELFLMFFRSVSSCKLNNLETLHLSIVPNMIRMSLVNPVFKSFFISLSSVKTLRTTNDILQFLVEVPKDDSIILPLLRTVEIVESHQQLDREQVLLFLLSRFEMGIPIETLDLTQCRNLTFPYLTFLERMEGLKVVWKSNFDDQQREYICGK